MQINKTFDVLGNTYRIAETSEVLVDADGAQSYTQIDREQHVLWVWSETPALMRSTLIAQAVSLLWRDAVSDPSSLDLPSVGD